MEQLKLLYKQEGNLKHLAKTTDKTIHKTWYLCLTIQFLTPWKTEKMTRSNWLLLINRVMPFLTV